MDLQTRKQNLLDYVLRQLFELDFVRESSEYARAHGFDSYRDFVQTQTDYINGFNEGSLATMEFLRDQLLPMTEVLISDDLSFIPPRGFYLSKSGKIIFVISLP